MKKNILLIIITLTLLLTTGCFKRDKMEDIDIITTIYPIEYITNRLYGENSNITSIYPREINIKEFKLTKKLIKDYSNKDLLIYNGESEEREMAKSFLNKNHSLKIIDASYGVDLSYSTKNIWLNPSNILMIAQNIKNELKEYITNPYIINEINNQYELFKVDISELETELKNIADNSKDKRIIALDESLKFLEKYGYTVINLTENNETKENNLLLAKDLLANKNLNYIFITENDKNNELVNDLKNNYDAEIATFKVLETIKEEDLNNNKDYISIMYENFELIRNELY